MSTIDANAKVVVLCGGFGTRLREETEYRPKPMVEIGNKPILWHIMKIYSHYGFHDFVLCLGYKGEMIKKYFYHYELLNNDFTIQLGQRSHIEVCRSQSGEDWKVTLADTGKNAMTGARLKRIEHYIDTELFLLTYGDGVADIDIRKLVDFHRSHGKIGTVTGVSPQSRFGELEVHGSRVVNFSEKPQTGQGLINGGFFVFDRRFLAYVNEDDSCVLEREPLERLSGDGELMVYPHRGFWQCVDTYRDLQLLNSMWDQQNRPWVVWEQIRKSDISTKAELSS